MQEFEFDVPHCAQGAEFDSAIETTCISEGLEIGMKSSLATFPGSVHWHFKMPGKNGTLEITSFTRDKRIWAKVQSGRSADWIEPCLMRVKASVEKILNDCIKPSLQS
jgi:hypothetical protein